MKPGITAVTTLFLFSTSTAIFACDPPREEPSEAAVEEQEEEALELDEADDEPAEDRRQQTADEADRQLRQRLMGRVMEVAHEQDFAAAVDVCHDEAIPLTDEIGEEFGVEIGRVSDRLRNPDNVGHDWVWELIDEAEGEPRYVANDTLRAVKPISIAQPCLNCHGQQDELAAGVPDLLAEKYPDDQATGYELGELRGWVWVEVP